MGACVTDAGKSVQIVLHQLFEGMPQHVRIGLGIHCHGQVAAGHFLSDLGLTLDIVYHLGVFIHKVTELIIVVFLHADVHTAYCDILGRRGKLGNRLLDDPNQGQRHHHRHRHRHHCESRRKDGAVADINLLLGRIRDARGSLCG